MSHVKSQNHIQKATAKQDLGQDARPARPLIAYLDCDLLQDYTG